MQWPLTTLRERLVRSCVRIVGHDLSIVFQMAEMMVLPEAYSRGAWQQPPQSPSPPDWRRESWAYWLPFAADNRRATRSRLTTHFARQCGLQRSVGGAAEGSPMFC